MNRRHITNPTTMKHDPLASLRDGEMPFDVTRPAREIAARANTARNASKGHDDLRSVDRVGVDRVTISFEGALSHMRTEPRQDISARVAMLREKFSFARPSEAQVERAAEGLLGIVHNGAWVWR
jgi:hypothetical protein